MEWKRERGNRASCFTNTINVPDAGRHWGWNEGGVCGWVRGGGREGNVERIEEQRGKWRLVPLDRWPCDLVYMRWVRLGRCAGRRAGWTSSNSSLSLSSPFPARVSETKVPTSISLHIYKYPPPVVFTPLLIPFFSFFLHFVALFFLFFFSSPFPSVLSDESKEGCNARARDLCISQG